MDLWLRHKRVCVTGATSGIGLAIANAFALEGCDIALCGPEPERIDSAVAALRKTRVRVFGEPLSRQNVAAVGPWIDRMSRALGGIDILVVNVSANCDDWQDAVAIDLGGTRAAVEAAIPHVSESLQGSIVGIAPPSSSVDTANGLAQAALTAAMTQYMRTLAVKLIEDGIRVNVMSPGGIIEPDDDFDRLRAADPELYSVLSNNPMCRRATPEELARVAVFMASPAASFVTGANWIVDGGSVARHS